MAAFIREMEELKEDLEDITIRLQDLSHEEEYTSAQREYFEGLENVMESIYRRVYDDIRYNRLPGRDNDGREKSAMR